MTRRYARSSFVSWALVGLATGAACFRESDTTEPLTESSSESSGALSEGGLTITQGGHGSDSAETGTGTGEGACMLDNECADDDPCSLDVCDNHVCDHLPLDGVPTADQTIGDCQRVMCMAGAPQSVPQPEDRPDDDNDCTSDACSEDGEVEHMPEPLGSNCSGSGSCDGMGTCVECLSPDDCDMLPVDDDCAMRTCEAGVCGQIFAPAGTLVNATLQMAGDCQRVVCDGEGGTVSEANNTDPYIDGFECTQDFCSAGTPENPALPSGTPCAAGECNAFGQCTGCNEADDCGDATSCQAPTCNGSGVCGVANTSEGTPLPGAMQDDGDCQELRCDGNGASGSYEDNDDVPADDGNDCTTEECNGGLPQHPDAPAGTPCGDGAYCDGMGACVECIDAGDCPPAGQCHVAVCEDNQCGVEPADSGTPCSDGLFCTATDTCNAAGTCVGTVNPCTGADGDADCSESCDETANACTGNDPSGSPCNDGQYCTQSDACNANGMCVGSGSPCTGADGDADCSESCDEASDACTAPDPAGSDCDDGLACTTADACMGGTCTGSAVPCVDPQACFESCGGCGDAEC